MRNMIEVPSVLVVIALIGALHPVSAAEQTITLASTTSAEATGLLANILPQFTAKTGITVRLVAQPTARALDIA